MNISKNQSQASLNDSTLNIAASQMVRLNLADVNVAQLPSASRNPEASHLQMKGTFLKQSDVNQLEVGVGRGLFTQGQPQGARPGSDAQSGPNRYARIPARIKSIRRSDDNLMKKTKKFEKQYNDAMVLQ